MKRVYLILGAVIALGTSTINLQAHGCGFGFNISIPFVSLGIGLGCGYPCGVYGTAYSYPTYSYRQPDYGYDAYNAPTIPATSTPTPYVPAESVWVPSTPGVGHWVADPQPYSYTAGKGSPAAPTARPQTVTTLKSGGGVPVYVISQ